MRAGRAQSSRWSSVRRRWGRRRNRDLLQILWGITARSPIGLSCPRPVTTAQRSICDAGPLPCRGESLQKLSATRVAIERGVFLKLGINRVSIPVGPCRDQSSHSASMSSGYVLCVCVLGGDSAQLGTVRLGISIEQSSLFWRWRPVLHMRKETLSIAQGALIHIAKGVNLVGQLQHFLSYSVEFPSDFAWAVDAATVAFAIPRASDLKPCPDGIPYLAGRSSAEGVAPTVAGAMPFIMLGDWLA